MDPAVALEIGKLSIYTLLQIALPVMLVALIVGLTISLFQALTQIQEMTLSFVPKMIAIFLSLLLLLPMIGEKLANLSETLMAMVVSGAV